MDDLQQRLQEVERLLDAIAFNLVDPIREARIRLFPNSEKADFDPDHDQESVCKCGHAYRRHFDWMENNEHVGCKYCPCAEFVEPFVFPSFVQLAFPTCTCGAKTMPQGHKHSCPVYREYRF